MRRTDIAEMGWFARPYLPPSLCCVLYGSQQHDQGVTLLWWQLLAVV